MVMRCSAIHRTTEMMVVTVVVLNSVLLLIPPSSISHTHHTDSHALSTPLWLSLFIFVSEF